MRHLVLGCAGLVGSELFERLVLDGADVYGTVRATAPQIITQAAPEPAYLDLTDKPKVKTLIKTLNPDIVWLSAAKAGVDFCETSPNEAYRTNVVGTQNVLESLNKNQLIVFFSTDYVFDGKCGPYSEHDLVNPINEYGKQKLIAEMLVKEACRHYIVRTSWVFGPRGNNFTNRFIHSIRRGQKWTVSNTQTGSPTFVSDLVYACTGLAASGASSGIYNICGSSVVSRFELAILLAKRFNLNTSLVYAGDVEQPATRPLKCGLTTDLISKTIGHKMLTISESISILDV